MLRRLLRSLEAQRPRGTGSGDEGRRPRVAIEASTVRLSNGDPAPASSYYGPDWLGLTMDEKDIPVDSLVAKAPHFRWASLGITVLIVSIGLAAILSIATISDNTLDVPAKIGIALGAGFGSGLIYGGLGYFISLYVRRRMFYSYSKIEHISRSSEALQGALEQDFVTNLVRINFKYIDAYYLQTRIQADKSFTVTVAAAVVSLTLIVVGIVLMYFGGASAATATGGVSVSTTSAPINPGAIGSPGAIVGSAGGTAAIISAAAGILGQFISAVFFYLYNQTVAKMAEYHRKLVFTQNIGLALKISDGLPSEQKTIAQLELIQTLSKDINQYLGS